MRAPLVLRLLPAIVALLLAGLPGAGEASQIRVGAGEEVTTLTEAVALAPEGGRIVVGPGVYREGTIRVDRRVTIVGEGGPVVDGEGRGTVLHLTADGVEIRGLVVRGSGTSHLRDPAAILVEGAGGCVIEGNHLEDNFFGIYLARAHDCRITRNRIEASAVTQSASANGIHLWNARRVRIEGNQIRGHRDGIYLEFAEDSAVRGNVSEGNLRYGLHFMFSHRTDASHNRFRRNGAGVAVMFSTGVVLRGNRFVENRGPAAYGLLAKEIRDSEIADNDFVRNTVGLHSDGSDRVSVHGNRFVSNGWAVRLLASSQENRFTGNDFVENAFDVTTNSRHNFNTFRGNFWSQYRGYDLAGDGYGDVPHRPVRLFALIAERNPTALVLLRSLFVDLLDVAERVLPVLTPETLVDDRPSMREVAR